MLLSIQAGRGVAALLVLLYHLNTAVFGRDKYYSGQPFGPIFDFGSSGVDYFFVLSGFIIFYAHTRDIGDPRTVPRYLWRRFTRIFPVYWVVLLPLIAIYSLYPAFGTGQETEPSTIISSLFLVYINGNTVLGTAWTLYHEILFYITFIILLCNRTYGVVFYALWGVAILAFQYLAPADTAPIAEFLGSPLNLLFGMGMLAALIHRTTAPLPAAGVLAFGGVGLFLGNGLMQVYGGGIAGGTFLYGFASVMLLLGFASLELANRIRVPAAMVLLGEASYSIYITHLPLLSVFAKISIRLGLTNHMPAWALFIAIFAVTLALGVAFHLVVEKPLLARLAAWQKARSALRQDGKPASHRLGAS
ncbi:acyltransferase family protein [Inquilinus limosus]|uniref:Acyltransferase 3 domain-containing protein n=1 Tax=Inquilinus limosus TaxID=171674 RepID=A0A211ZI99_9PROT|nr:acyltransferase [Inquilinus limosus]OWJ64989.1 hypothetical protein BWR60_21715 [Inquilinus limosus]